MKRLIILFAILLSLVGCSCWHDYPSITFDYPVVKLDSSGVMYISNRGEKWYPLYFDPSLDISDSTLTKGTDACKLKRRYSRRRFKIGFVGSPEIAGAWDNPEFYQKYHAEFHLKLFYSDRMSCGTWLNRMPSFKNIVPSTVSSEIPDGYLDSNIFLIKTAIKNKYVIIPDCYWNMADVINYNPIVLIDENVQIEDSGHRYFHDTVYSMKSNIRNYSILYESIDSDNLIYQGTIMLAN